MGIFPYRIRFTKTGKMRFLSHHDLMRLFDRALRRSGLPLRMTEGFNPHPIVSFPTALGLGIESLDEVMEFELSEWAAPHQLERVLKAQFPEGIEITLVETFPRKQRGYIDFVEYEALCPGQTSDLKSRIRDFLETKERVVERASDKGVKKVDIRPYVMNVDSEGDRVFLRIRVTDSGTAKPEEVLRSIGIEIREDVRVKKTYTELLTRE